MYDFAGKSFDDMTVAELRTYLAQPEIAPHVVSEHNTKTRKAELILIASAAHRVFQDSGDADKLRNKMLSAVDVADMPAEPAQGLNQPRGESAKLDYLAHQGHATPLAQSKRMANYLGDRVTGTSADLDRLTPKQIHRLTKKSRALAAINVRVRTGAGKSERI